MIYEKTSRRQGTMGKEVGVQKYNVLCAKCLRVCKQLEGSHILDCPRYLHRPFKIVEHKFSQLDLFGGEKDEE
jgi:hypothetical protein